MLGDRLRKVPPTLRTSKAIFENPLFAGDYSDPTIRGEYYYLICAEGGTAGPPTSHMAVVAHCKSPLGPWENSPHNPLIHTYSADEDWWSVGHGSLVSTPDDRWYFVYHGYRKGFQTLGRNTLLEPVEWTSDGWPRAPWASAEASRCPRRWVLRSPMIELSDDFKAPVLKATWQAWKETDMSRYQAGDGVLIVRAKGNSYAESSPLTIMAQDENYEVQVVAKIEAQSRAALGLEYNPKVAVFVELKRGQLNVYGPKGKLATRAVDGDRRVVQNGEPEKPCGDSRQRGRAEMAKSDCGL